MPVKSSLRDKLEDDVLDLSLMQLDQIPVKDIAPLTKGTSLDLSNNLLTYVPESFSTLTHLVKLDLSKNQITELPEYFGNLQNLRHLDLYSNKLERLPVSFAQLKNLKWLDLKKNPLVPALRQAAGPCITNLECTTCAKKVVALLQSLQSQLENKKKLWVMEEKRNLQRRLENEEAERERIKAEKKAASAKRRKENTSKDNGEKKVKQKSGSPNSSFQKEIASQIKLSGKGNTSIDGGNQIESSRSFSWIFFLGMLYFLTILGATGASALWLYTDGNLNQKSILRALPLMKQDFVSAYNMALEKALTAGSDFTNWSSKAMDHAGVSLQAGWKEFMRRNDVLAQYVNMHYGPYFCYCKKSLYLQWQNLQSFLSHFMTNTMRPLLHDAQRAVWPYVEQVVEFFMDKSKGFVSFLSSAME